MTSSFHPVRWYSSFYWRIGVSFVVFVIVVLVGQSLMVGYARSRGSFAPGNPNATAIAVAAELGKALTDDPGLDLSRAVPAGHPSAYALMADGRNAASSTRPLRLDIRRQVQAALAGDVPVGEGEDSPTGPVVTAPIQVHGRLVGLVVLPPPPPRGLLSDVAELMSLPGTLDHLRRSALVEQAWRARRPIDRSDDARIPSERSGRR